MSSRIRVGFWRIRLLPGSETFIRTQERGLEDSASDVRTFGFAPVFSPLQSDRDLFPFRGYQLARVMTRIFRVTRRSRRLDRLIRSISPEVVHAHFGSDAALIVPTLRRLGIPMVMSVYGYDVSRAHSSDSRGRRDAARLREAFEYAAAIIANSGFMGECAVARGADPAKVHVVHLGVELTEEPRAETVAAREGILFVGRFTEKKGIDDLITALSILPEHLKATPVTLIGDGDGRAALENRARLLGLNVRFLGNQTHKVVKEELQRAAILVAPSKTAPDGDSEGLPTVILEAAQAAVPVVSTWHSGIPEAVIDGETGLLVGEGATGALAAALARLIADPELAKAFGAQGREHIRSEFDIAICARRLENVYARAVERHR